MKVRACDLCGEVIKGDGGSKIRITPDDTEKPSASGEVCDKCMIQPVTPSWIYMALRNRKEGGNQG